MTLFRKNRKNEEMNYLEEHNKKESRVAVKKEERRNFIQTTYKLTRNVIISGIVIGVGVYFFSMWYFRDIPTKEAYEFDRERIAGIVAEITRPLSYDEVGFRMQSEFALLINISTGRVLFDHRGEVQTFPASVTKIMTVLLGLENGTMDENIVITADFDALFLSGALQSGFNEGEIRTLSEVLHAIMLPSGAEAVWALANHVAGSYEAFIELMNEKAQELGMNNTHFVTATGLHDENHYTTAYDIAILLQYALENPDFRAIFTATTYQPERPTSLGSVLTSTLFRSLPDPTFPGGEILGGRTGFTTPAGRCLASLATNGEDDFILITFGAPDPYFTNTTAHILDALLIYEYFLDVEEADDW